MCGEEHQGPLPSMGSEGRGEDLRGGLTKRQLWGNWHGFWVPQISPSWPCSGGFPELCQVLCLLTQGRYFCLQPPPNHPSNHPYVHPRPIHPSTFPSIHPSITPYKYLSIHFSITKKHPGLLAQQPSKQCGKRKEKAGVPFFA